MSKIVAMRNERQEKPWEIKVIAWIQLSDSVNTEELKDVFVVSNYPESYILT